jgi:hypothetical protein
LRVHLHLETMQLASHMVDSLGQLFFGHPMMLNDERCLYVTRRSPALWTTMHVSR